MLLRQIVGTEVGRGWDGGGTGCGGMGEWDASWEESRLDVLMPCVHGKHLGNIVVLTSCRRHGRESGER